jgi:hypothetical protein
MSWTRRHTLDQGVCTLNGRTCAVCHPAPEPAPANPAQLDALRAHAASLGLTRDDVMHTMDMLQERGMSVLEAATAVALILPEALMDEFITADMEHAL